MTEKAKAIISHGTLQILNFSNFYDFKISLESIIVSPVDYGQVQRLIISGSTIDCFDFISLFPALKQLSFLACESDNWTSLKGSASINSLRLHNLKQKKQYLNSIDFVITFSNLEYLYINMLGLNNFSELQGLNRLHTIFAQIRNENDIKKQFDFAELEFMSNLKFFDVWMAVDRHRIPAESLIPVLKNSTILHVGFTQMYSTEDKKLRKLIEEINPNLLLTSLPNDEVLLINKHNFAW